MTDSQSTKRYVYAPWGALVATFRYFHDAEDYARWRSECRPGSEWTVEGLIEPEGILCTTIFRNGNVIDETAATLTA